MYHQYGAIETLTSKRLERPKKGKQPEEERKKERERKREKGSISAKVAVEKIHHIIERVWRYGEVGRNDNTPPFDTDALSTVGDEVQKSQLRATAHSLRSVQ